MTFTEKLLIRTIIPLLFRETIIRDKNQQIITVLRGIPLQPLQEACKTPKILRQLLEHLQKRLTLLEFTLQIYSYDNNYYLTCISQQKLGSYLSESQAFVLGVFITLREQRKEPVLWSELEKELREGAVIISKIRNHVEFLVSRGLLYKPSTNPLRFEYGPTFFLEFDEEGISKITSMIRNTLLIGTEVEASLPPGQ